MAQVKFSFRNNRDRNLAALFILIGFLVLGLASLVKSNNPDQLPAWLEFLAIILALVLWGCVGLIAIIHKEVYQFVFTIKGTLAVVWGVCILLFCWGGALYLIVKYFLR